MAIVGTKTSELAKKHGITTKELHLIIEDAGLDIRKNARIIPEEFIADLEVILSDKEMTQQVIDQPEEEEEVMATVELPPTLTIAEFAKAIDHPVVAVMTNLMKSGVMLNQNEFIPFDTAALVAADFDIEAVPMKGFAEKKREELDIHLVANEGDEKRPPVISVLGHVDHGKTSLLDAIRGAAVADGEAGGITQSIGAYQITKHGEKITFLDTPGHEAFTEMRARGAQATDIAILVVAADDGVMPQTKEAISHAKNAGVPVIVAITKIDKAGSNLEKIKGELTEFGLTAEDWGGDTVVIPLSAHTGQGINDLEEAILLQAEMMELKANYTRAAVGVVIEAHLDSNLGPVATLLVRNGDLKKADIILAGSTYGKIRLMIDDRGQTISHAGPSTPVLVSGLSEVPRAGEIFEMEPDLANARMLAEQAKQASRSGLHLDPTLANISDKIRAGDIKDLKIILKSDTHGSSEALSKQINSLSTNNVATHIIHSDVGAVNNGDVLMAKASGAIIIAFNVRKNPTVEAHAESEGIVISHYDVIYSIINDLKQTMLGLLAPEIVQKLEATLRVKQVFFHGKGDMIVGVGVEKGTVRSKLTCKVFRTEEEVGQGKINQVRRKKDLVKEITEGHECGITFDGKLKIEEGDIIECYSREEVYGEL